MGFRNIFGRTGFSTGTLQAHRSRALMDTLESRSLLSSSVAVQTAAIDSNTPAAATTLAASTTKLSITSATTTTIGIPTTLAARVGSATGGATPTGRVAFYDGSTVLASKKVNSLGVARLQANYLYVGTHNLKAIYFGSSTYLAHRSVVKPVTVKWPTLSTATDGLKVGTVTAGSGPQAGFASELFVHYTGYLSNGTKFESSLDDGQPFHFFLGLSNVIDGWQEGLSGIRAGEKRVLIIPPALAYGAHGSDNIPPNATIVFVIEAL